MRPQTVTSKGRWGRTNLSPSPPLLSPFLISTDEIFWNCNLRVCFFTLNFTFCISHFFTAWAQKTGLWTPPLLLYFLFLFLVLSPLCYPSVCPCNTTICCSSRSLGATVTRPCLPTSARESRRTFARDGPPDKYAQARAAKRLTSRAKNGVFGDSTVWSLCLSEGKFRELATLTCGTGRGQVHPPSLLLNDEIRICEHWYSAAYFTFAFPSILIGI